MYYTLPLFMDFKTITNEIDSYAISKSYQCQVDDAHNFFDKTTKNLTILCQNIRSIDRNLPQIEILLNRLKFDVDILILTECWLNKLDYLPSLANFTSFSSVHNKTQNEGVVAFIRNDISPLVEEPLDFEANCIIIKLGSETAIVAIYRPPSYRTLENFLFSLEQILSSLKSYRNVILIGDININIAHSNNNAHNCNDYLDLLAQHELLAAHCFPTRETSCLDHIFLKTDLNATALVMASTITDHYTTALILENHRHSKNTFNLYKTINYDSLLSSINIHKLNEIFETEDVNKATNILVRELKYAIDLNTITKKIPCRKQLKEPWLTPGLLRCIKHRDKLHQQSNNDPENKTLKLIFKRYRNYCGEILKKVRTEYNKNNIRNVVGDSKKTWKVIKNIAKFNSKKYISELQDRDLLSIKDSAVASINFINSYFANIGNNLASVIISSNGNSDRPSPSSLSIESSSQSFGLFATDFIEIDSIIMSLKTCSAAGHDGIQTKVLKFAKDLIVPHITHICNLSFITGIFPNLFKTALIKPIYKGGDRDSISNYRPISILPALSKILERLLNKRLTSYLTKFKIISDNQFGFVSGRSTEDAVLELTNYVVHNVDKKNKCIGIFLDLAKAFDTVSVPILLNKMERMGIRDVALKLFTDYLSNRKQRVKIGDLLSDETAIAYGVPQGSILGPTLFLVYVNDLCKLQLKSSKTVVFADDTVLLFSAPTWDIATHLAEIGLKEVMSWLRDNLLTLNIDKTKYVSFSKSLTGQPCRNTLNIKAHTCSDSVRSVSTCSCSLLEQASSIKYLGVIMDQHLNWQKHIEVLTGRLRKLIVVFKRLRHIGDLSLLKDIYYALCHSLLAYCNLAWGGSFKTFLLPLERSQRAVLKVMLSKPFRYPTKQLYADTKILSVRQTFIYKAVLKTHSNTEFDSDSFHEKRRKDRLVCPSMFLSAYAQRHFCFQGPFLYKTICTSVNIYPLTFLKCRTAVKEFLLSQSYDDTENMLIIPK